MLVAGAPIASADAPSSTRYPCAIQIFPVATGTTAQSGQFTFNGSSLPKSVKVQLRACVAWAKSGHKDIQVTYRKNGTAPVQQVAALVSKALGSVSPGQPKPATNFSPGMVFVSPVQS